MSNTELWNNFLSSINEKINSVSYSYLFNNSSLYYKDDQKVIILVDNKMIKEILISTYYSILQEAFFNITGNNFEIDIVCNTDIEQSETHEDIVDKSIIPETNYETNLLEKFSFDNFVVGDTNRFAITSCKVVAENPGNSNNPLFIYGKSGLGKTHLMHAIGNYITKNTNLRVLYTPCEVFRTEYINIVTNKSSIESATKFKDKYRNVDVLIIDDIQYLVGAEKTQEEFFHIFNELHSKGKQIIISSDSSPDDLRSIQERLRSRFTSGLPVDIFPPDFELRCLIIKNKLNYYSYKDIITEEAIEYIASNSDNDVRKIMGILNRLNVVVALTTPKKITLDFAVDNLKDFLPKNVYTTNEISSIQKIVADYFKITVEALKSKKRSNNIAHPRQVAMYLCRTLTDKSYPQIGAEFGQRDHTTVMHSCTKIESDMKENQQLCNIINELKEKL